MENMLEQYFKAGEKAIVGDKADEFIQNLSEESNGGFITGTGNGFGIGVAIGMNLLREHRTLQGRIVNFLLGIIVGLSYGYDHHRYDDRNEVALKNCKKIAELVEEGDICANPFI